MTQLSSIFLGLRTIAVVGASRTPGKAAHDVPAYLEAQGYEVIPVNPNADVVRGREALRALADLPGPVDVVLVFRPAREAPAIARQAAASGARTLWLQTGIVSDEARRIAESAGLRVVMDACIATTHWLLGLGPGPLAAPACPLPRREPS